MKEKTRIILADAAQDFRRMACELLASESDLDIVGETGSGEELLELIRSTQPQVVVMDLVLSGMDGLAVLERLGSERPKILVLSAFAHSSFSDRLPALIVDSFGDVLVLQCLALGMERFKQDVVDALVEEVHPQGIYERSDVPVRRLEGLEQLTGVMYGTVPDRVEMVENGVHFWVDVKEGQKTGFFLDQKENRAAIAPFVKGKTVLDCFTHTGSFALHAGHYGAKEVTGVDISAFACEFATENARLNGLENVVHFVEANAFDLLAEQSRAGAKYAAECAANRSR